MQALLDHDAITFVPESDDDLATIILMRRSVPIMSGRTDYKPLPWAPERSAFVESFRIKFVLPEAK